ncbi:barstar family protein [Polynucleobacter paneuropaeus]|nr:barstar family protein [Polynucleobacter paneuropaeus]
MNNQPENTSSAVWDEHSRAESWDSSDRLETESSAANVYAQGGLSRLQNFAANQASGKKVTASWRAALAVRDAGPPAMLRSVRTNIVQSIRAFRTPDLAEAASELGQHFIYANCANAMTKGEVLEAIANAYMFTKQQAKNFDPLLDALTTMVDKAGPQTGFVVVLEGLPCTQKFDKEARETLLDVFRDAVDFWSERRIPYRVFYSFA